MMISWIVVFLGLIIGSFLNVVIYRLPLDQSVVKPGSHCPCCKNAIAWYQNIPVFSYLWLKGKCANCSAPIHWRYPLVEVLTGILFWFSFRGLPLDFHAVIAQIRIWTFISICISVCFIDFDYRIIPDELSIGGWVFGAITAYFDFRHSWSGLLIASVAGFGFFFLFALLYEKITDRVGLGGGDIKFMGTIGVFLGLGGIWTSLMVSSVVGSIVGIALATLQKRKSGRPVQALRTAIPYGPFLVLGALVELFFEVSQWIGL